MSTSVIPRNSDLFQQKSGWIVSGIGLVLSGVHLLHGFEEIAEALPAVLFGVAIPLAVSFFIVLSGYRIATENWSPASPVRIVQWSVAGFVIGVGLISLLVHYQAAEQVTLSDTLYVLAMFGTYGAAFGIVVGRYDVQRQAQHIEQKRKSERLEEFASIVSHDLRNPLTVAEGRLELAQEDCETEHLGAVERAHDRMNRLIDDLLTLAREGETALSLERIDLADTVQTCWKNVETHDATLVTELTQTVQADPVRLSQLFENLIRNAVEHGGAAVTITIGDLEDGFYVQDDGPGIPPEERADVFEQGYSTAPESTGFGLAIVREIVESHGWDIRITDRDNRGTRFEITNVT